MKGKKSCKYACRRRFKQVTLAVSFRFEIECDRHLCSEGVRLGKWCATREMTAGGKPIYVGRVDVRKLRQEGHEVLGMRLSVSVQ
jgi:hypothetical protein